MQICKTHTSIYSWISLPMQLKTAQIIFSNVGGRPKPSRTPEFAANRSLSWAARLGANQPCCRKSDHTARSAYHGLRRRRQPQHSQVLTFASNESSAAQCMQLKKARIMGVSFWVDFQTTTVRVCARISVYAHCVLGRNAFPELMQRLVVKSNCTTRKGLSNLIG